jgi:hypothetical protein
LNHVKEQILQQSLSEHDRQTADRELRERGYLHFLRSKACLYLPDIEKNFPLTNGYKFNNNLRRRKNEYLLKEGLMLAKTHSESPDPDDINGAALLDHVSQFIGRYLQSSEHQVTVMALWALHTYCLPAARVTPYLFIQSTEKQSGKTLCLQLLSLLCDSPALTAGFTASNLTRRMDGSISTILLDECQATLGTRARSKGPVLRAILASGHLCGPGYTDSTHERNAFGPKAFAGMGQLPEALADRSIPIILKPLNNGANGVEAFSGAKPAARPKVERLNLPQAAAEAKLLQQRLSAWTGDNLEDLGERPSYAQEDFPPNLSPRRQDMSEPLLQLADAVGGEWPVRIREALAHIFQEESALDLQQSRQLLSDLRDCFVYHGYPERLSTSTLLAWMHSLPARPWDVDGPITARALARLLVVFDIRPRVQRPGSANPASANPGSANAGSANPARGYQLQDFVEPWQAHLGFNLPAGNPEAAESVSAVVTDAGPSEIPNKDAACNTVTDLGAISVSTPQKPVRKEENPVAFNPAVSNGLHTPIQPGAV